MRVLACLRSCVLVRIIICVRSHYVALARLTTLLRRAGRLDEAPRHIKVHWRRATAEHTLRCAVIALFALHFAALCGTG